MPDAPGGEGFGFAGHSRRKFFAAEISEVKIIFRIHRDGHVFFAGPQKNDPVGFLSHAAQLDIPFRRRLAKGRMPLAIIGKGPGTA